MALFGKSNVPLEEVKQLKMQGFSDNEIIDELKGRGYPLSQINNALAQSAISEPGVAPEIENPDDFMASPEETPSFSENPSPIPTNSSFPEELQGRIEEITESIIDEKWDLLIEEVKKIVEWKSKVEEEVNKLKTDISNLKDDFKELHQGVLGKLESYDEKMTEVGTELKAVGKVFQDVIPEFVDNVKELRAITREVKGKKK